MPFGAYCYTTMSFRLKNAGATYQRAIQMYLDQQIGRNIEAYIDDVVVKSKTVDNLIADLEETFANLKRYRWKLNPSNCIFRVPSDILLGYIVSACGIEPNPNKVSAITNMKRPTCVNGTFFTRVSNSCVSVAFLFLITRFSADQSTFVGYPSEDCR